MKIELTSELPGLYSPSMAVHVALITGMEKHHDTHTQQIRRVLT
jgi:hypothetical protein